MSVSIRVKMKSYNGEIDLGDTMLDAFKWTSLYPDVLEPVMSANYSISFKVI